MKLKYTILALAAMTAVANAAAISVNIREGNANQIMATTATAGIGGHANWNNTDGTFNGSTIGSLIDSDCAVTTAAITWGNGAGGGWGDATANGDADLGIGDAQLMRG